MSAVACNGSQMAADGQGSSDNGHIFSTTDTKLFRHEDGVFGWVGDAVSGIRFERWICVGRPESERPEIDENFCALEMHTEGAVTYWCSKLEPQFVSCPHAIGSGGPYALGAMMAGASPDHAVRIAARCDAFTGGEIEHLWLLLPAGKEVVA